MRLGDIVTVVDGAKAGRPHVVVGGPVDGRVRLCYCGTGRWYVPEWTRRSSVGCSCYREGDDDFLVGNFAGNFSAAPDGSGAAKTSILVGASARTRTGMRLSTGT